MPVPDLSCRRLTGRPTVVLDPGADVTAQLLLYDPVFHRPPGRRSRYVLLNGVHLCGPVAVTPDLAARTRLPEGSAYYADARRARGTGRARSAARRDAETLVRGLAARLAGTAHAPRAWTPVPLALSVYAARPVPTAMVVNALQPLLDPRRRGAVRVSPHSTVPGSYLLVGDDRAMFVGAFWPGRLAAPDTNPPPPALGPLRGQRPCRWELSTGRDVTRATPEQVRALDDAAAALADVVCGVVIDMFGFPITGKCDPSLTGDRWGVE